jgi:selenocysteine lyase/cysteine desulfurase
MVKQILTIHYRISDYLSNSNVQLGASYKTGQWSTDLFNKGIAAAARYINASNSEVVIGPSTTQLFRNLSISLDLKPGDEFLLSKLNHEANTAPWVDIAERLGLVVKWWDVPKSTNPRLSAESLRPFMSERTKIVAIPHVSNILGTLHDVRAIADVVHQISGAMLCVDGVAYAPHGGIDVRELGIDFYGFSWYKVCHPS